MLTSPAGGTARAVWAVASTLAALLLLWFAAEWFRVTWAQVGVETLQMRIGVAWSVAGLALLVGHAGSSIRLWWQVVGATGTRFSGRDAIDTFIPSLLARYVPGKVWANGARLVLARRAGVSLSGGAGAMLWEMGTVFAAGGLVASVAFAIAGERRYLLTSATLAAASLVGILGLSALAASPRVNAYGRFARWMPGLEAMRAPGARGAAFATAIAGWVAYGAAHVSFLFALGPVTLDQGALVAGGVALAWAAGVLAFVAPAGLGVRDGLLYLILAGTLDPARALVYAVLTRLAQFVVDALLTSTWLAIRLTERRRARGS